ncbi:VAMP2 [Bugula neritina]|uniref:VAMP2 n=1 Tax=Bugula neritina TaxID=10212 RepID=A0A7J7K1I0_BUGNE|nr:VAMP2 [Bugula neritina]
MQQQAAGKRLQQTQAQVNEVSVSLMLISIITWWSCLPHLLFPTLLRTVRRYHLQAGASQFEAAAGKLKRKFWWKNCKMMIILGVVITLVLVVVGVWIAQKTGALGGGNKDEVTTVANNPAAGADNSAVIIRLKVNKEMAPYFNSQQIY